MQSHPSDERATQQRRHLLRTLFAGVALGSSGHIAAVTIATIVGQELAGGSA